MIKKCKSCNGKGYHESHNQICVCDCKSVKYFNTVLVEGTEEYDKYQMGDL